MEANRKRITPQTPQEEPAFTHAAPWPTRAPGQSCTTAGRTGRQVLAWRRGAAAASGVSARPDDGPRRWAARRGAGSACPKAECHGLPPAGGSQRPRPPAAPGYCCDSTYFLFGGFGERKKKCLSKVCVVGGRVGGRRPSPASSGPGKKDATSFGSRHFGTSDWAEGKGISGATQRRGRD